MSNKKSSFGLIYCLYIKLINDHVFMAIGAQAIMSNMDFHSEQSIFT